LIQLQTEADMRRASDDETAAVPSAAATEHGPLKMATSLGSAGLQPKKLKEVPESEDTDV
jgi:hypothetical protein